MDVLFGRFLEAGRKQLILCYIICTVPVATPLPGAGSGYHCTNHQQLKSSNRQQPTTTHNDQPNNDATATIATTHTQHPKPRLPLGRGGLRPFPNPCTTCPSSFFSKPIVILRYVLCVWLISAFLVLDRPKLHARCPSVVAKETATAAAEAFPHCLQATLIMEEAAEEAVEATRRRRACR